MTEYVFWIWQWFRSEILAIPGRLIALLFVMGLLFLPAVTTQAHVLRILTFTAVFAVYAASWDVLAGYTGQVNLGQTLFFGVAAYSAALLNLHLNLPPWVTIPSGAIVAVLAGLVVGIPALRLRGFYLSLVTLAFPVILTGLVFVFSDFTGGELGLIGVDRLSHSRVWDYYLVLIIMLVCLFAMFKFTDPGSQWIRVGLILHGIREDEITARTSGIHTTRYKLMAFAVSGFFAGIAGGLYAHLIRIAGPSTLELFFSFQAILWTVFGGMGTIYGPVAGVFILYPLVEFVRLHPVGEAIRFVLFALMLILTLLFMPEGLTTWVRDKIEVNCPRCKLINVRSRRYCRVCRAPLHRDFKKTEA